MTGVTALAATWTDDDRWSAAVKLYGGKVRTFARNSFRQIPGFDREDVEQELMIVLWRCVQQYDPNRGASFNTLFQGCAKNKVISLIRHFETQSRKAHVVSLGDDDVASAVEEYLSVASAEEIGLMRLQISEYVADYGEGVLSGDHARQLQADRDQRSA